MSSSSSTPPAERTRPSAPRHRGSGRPILWALLAVWCCLILFGVISLENPPWLRALSSGGQETEARGYVGSGDALARQGSWQGALDWYDRALRVDPEHLPARINRAIAYGRLGLADQGLASLREALNGNPPGRGSILYNIAELHRQKGDVTRAISCYEEALTVGAPPELVYGRLGEVHAERNELGEACSALRAALDARKDPLAAYRQVFVEAREDEDLDSLHRCAIDATLAGELNRETLVRYDMEFLQDQVARDPERARLLGRLGGLEAAQGERAAALEHLRASLQIWPGNPDAKRIRALVEQLGAAGPLPGAAAGR